MNSSWSIKQHFGTACELRAAKTQRTFFSGWDWKSTHAALPYSKAHRLSDPDPLTHIPERASSTRSWTAPRAELIPTNCPQKLTSVPQTPGTAREAAAHGWNPPRVVNPSLAPAGPPEGRNPVQLEADNMGQHQSTTEHVWRCLIWSQTNKTGLWITFFYHFL